MKRDTDLLRHLLLTIEDDEKYKHKEKVKEDSRFEAKYGEHWEDAINEHNLLLHEAGFIEAQIVQRGDGYKTVYPFRLTYKGTEFLDCIRDGKVWRNTKEKISLAGGATIPIIQKVASSILESMLFGIK